MRLSHRLWQHACRITLFTHDACSLCRDAKRVLSAVQKQTGFVYVEKNIKQPENQAWADIYAFDVPVVSRACRRGPRVLELTYQDPCGKERERGGSESTQGAEADASL